MNVFLRNCNLNDIFWGVAIANLICEFRVSFVLPCEVGNPFPTTVFHFWLIASGKPQKFTSIPRISISQKGTSSLKPFLGFACEYSGL